MAAVPPGRGLFWLAALLAMLFALPARAQDDAAASKSDDAEEEGADETKQLLKKLTITMAAEVIDERTFAIRDSSSARKQVHLRLGNCGLVPRGTLEDGEYEEKVKVAKDALSKFVDKQMIWFKAAPQELQPANETDKPSIVIADVWNTEGRHLPLFMKKEGHLSDAQEYECDLCKDILSVAAEEEKKESYKKLEEALKESEKAKKEAAKAAREKAQQEEEETTEGLGFGGWVGISLLLMIVVGVMTNFGRPANKKTNLNKKSHGFFGDLFQKFKPS
jgi:hypothetical protein